jgi:hypothetical protein
MDWNVFAWIVFGFVLSLVVVFPVIKHLLDRRARYQRWFWASAHEVGHALVGHLACQTTLAVKSVSVTSHGYSCNVEYKTNENHTLQSHEVWGLIALNLAGMAAEITVLGHLHRPKGCVNDLDQALKIIGLVASEESWQAENISLKGLETMPEPPDWTEIMPGRELDQNQLKTLEAGFRLAAWHIMNHRFAFDRARTLALPRYDQVVMLTAEEIVECFTAASLQAPL